VTRFLDTKMSPHRKEISDAVFSWVDKQISELSEDELIEFHEYKFSPPTKFGLAGKLAAPLKPQHAGCDEETLRAYFRMLLNTSTYEGKPFASEKTVNYLLHEWFGVGEAVEFPEGEHVHFSIEEFAFFFKGFLDRFQIHKDRNRSAVTQKQLVDFLFQNLEDVFEDKSKGTVYHKFSTLAKKGYNPNLDWKRNEHLKALIERKQS
jgi:hypothetical protein